LKLHSILDICEFLSATFSWAQLFQIYLFILVQLKKIAAISLLILLLFNLFGYRLFFYYAQQVSDSKLEANLDNSDYNEHELISFKTSFTLPYFTGSEKFERISGEIIINGKIYKYVKRKISNGEITLLCLPNYSKMSLESAKDDFFKTNTGIVQNSADNKGSHTHFCIAKMTNGIYDFLYDSDLPLSTYVQFISPFYPRVYNTLSSVIAVSEQPPQLT